MIGPEAFKEARQVHRAANKAKHCWADVVGEEHRDAFGNMQVEVDPLFYNDPWAAAAKELKDGSSSSSAPNLSCTSAPDLKPLKTNVTFIKHVLC